MTPKLQSSTEGTVRVMHPYTIIVSIFLIKSEGAGTARHKSLPAMAKDPTGHQ